MPLQRLQDAYSAYYLISDKEQQVLKRVLSNNLDSILTSFIIILLQELDNDLPKVFRLLNVKSGNVRLFNVAIYRKLVLLIKEVVILANYENFIDEDGFISLVEMAKSNRFEIIGIDRATIVRVFNKYGIKYNKRK